MIASWKLKPITRCSTGKGQCGSNLRGQVAPGTQYIYKKKKFEFLQLSNFSTKKIRFLKFREKYWAGCPQINFQINQTFHATNFRISPNFVFLHKNKKKINQTLFHATKNINQTLFHATKNINQTIFHAIFFFFA